MDNPGTESSNSALDTNQAASIFAGMLDGAEPQKEQPGAEASNESPEDRAAQLVAEEQAAEQTEEGAKEGEQSPESAQKYVVKIDGKEVEVSLDDLKNGYQRQQDYTRKTMEVAEARKAAEAEANQARNERQAYANNLQAIANSLQAVMQEQNQTNWEQLLQADPVEYLRQQHLFQQRQAQLQQVAQEQSRVQQLQQAEQDKQLREYMMRQQEELLAKVPEWKDEAKAKAEKAQLRDALKEFGFTDDELARFTDHRLVLLARKAVKFDEVMAKAKTAAQKIDKTPPKVERPGTGAAKVDGRSSAMQRLSKTGRVEDAAAVFASFL